MARVHLNIDDCMSPGPYTVGADEPLATAHDLMREHQIRHLPVVEGDKLVGLVSMRDLHLIETLRDVDPGTVKVSEAMQSEPYAVPVGTSLREVVIYMGAHKFGSAVVVDGERVVGVFTTVDALRAMASLLAD